MAAEKPIFEDFLQIVAPEQIPFVREVDQLLLDAGCPRGIETSKSGYVVSYKHGGNKKVILNFVFRKKGVMMRLYADGLRNYMPVIEGLPEEMATAIKKAPACRRMLNPELCNPKCTMGYEFVLDGEIQQKCRYNCFLIPLSEQANPHLMRILQMELSSRGDA